MKKVIGLVLIALVINVASASAQFAFGVKGGVNISQVHFNEDIINSDNLTGFQIGPMVEFTVPLIGVGMDAALMYSQKGVEIESKSFKADYLDIPVNFKWKFGVPVLKGYIAAGPYASFRVGGDKFWDIPNIVSGQIKTKSFGAGLNFGAGVQVIEHLQVGFNYDLGLTNNYSGYIDENRNNEVDGKNRGWSITAAILF